MLMGTVHVIILNGKTEKSGPQNMLFCNYVFKLTLSLYNFQNWITSDVRHKVDRFLLNTNNTQELKLPSQLQRPTGSWCIAKESLFIVRTIQNI
jgi:hypothetical protein